MKLTKFYKKYENTILTCIMLGICSFVVGFLFDCYFEANDDIYIKNLLSGNYTGEPESHNIQMLYPISLVLSLLYRVFGGWQVPVYGLFICICQGGCFYLILRRSVNFCKTTLGKIILLVVEALLFMGLFLWEFVFTQYTVTCTLLAATAAFRFYTTERNQPTKAFIKANISNILLVTLAFLIRSEMLLLVLPLIGVAGFCKWATEKPMFTIEHTKKYITIIGTILVSLALGQGIHMLAYSNEGWKTFTAYFDNRTELYDFQFIPPYEGNEEFYDSIGLSKSEQILLENYNFGLDEEINGDTLLQIAKYAASKKTEVIPFSISFSRSFGEYRYRTLHATDYPWNLVVLVSYGLLVVLAWKNRQYSYIWKIPLLGLTRTVLWMYILLGGRTPIRITHSLYLMELLIIGAMLLEQMQLEREKIQERKMPDWVKHLGTPITGIAVVLYLLIGIVALNESVGKVRAESEHRVMANREIDAMEDYIASNPSNFYFVDLYSSVSYYHPEIWEEAIPYSAKLLKNTDNSLQNYDIMGGWVSKSPLTDKKLSTFGIESMEKAIAEADNVYVIAKTTTEMQWLLDYYKEKGYSNNELSVIDTIDVDGKNIFYVYQMK